MHVGLSTFCIPCGVASDVSNVARPFDVSIKWLDALLKEFFQQGDLERQLGLPISMGMVRVDVACV